MSLINTQIQPFKTQAFHNGKFVEVTEGNLKGVIAVGCLAQRYGDELKQSIGELDAVFGAKARETILGLVGHSEPLGITCRYDRDTGVMTLLAIDGRPNLAALPVLLLWLYPEKLPLAYSVHVTDNPDLAVWTIVSLQRIEITQHADEVPARLEALRAAAPTPGRLDLLPTRPLPRPED